MLLMGHHTQTGTNQSLDVNFLIKICLNFKNKSYRLRPLSQLMPVSYY